VPLLVWYSICAIEIVIPRCRSSGALSIWSNASVFRVHVRVLVVQHPRDRRSERRLAVVDVTNVPM